jgi:hypothetical protein
MFSGVPVGRFVATMGTTTLLAGAQVNPRGANLHALVALASPWLFDAPNCVYVGAALIRHRHPLLVQHWMNKRDGN